MTTREASCSCGSLRISCSGEPTRVSVCHCLACQKRTGSAFGAQARYGRDQVRVEAGSAATHVRTADSGNRVTFHFCRECGATLFWELEAMPGAVAVALGAFDDPTFLAPRISIYEARMHGWLKIEGAEVEHLD